MAYEGYIDKTGVDAIQGWIFDDAVPNLPIVVEILRGDEVVCTVTADGFRPDLQAAGKGNGKHAFSVSVPGLAGGSGPLAARVKGQWWHLPSGGGRRFVTRSDYIFEHSLEFGLPRVATGFTEAPRGGDLLAARRVMAAYQRCAAEHNAGPADKQDLWAGVFAAHHQELNGLLRSKDAAALDAYLSDAHAKGITYGITQGPGMTETLRTSETSRAFIAGQTMDFLASFCESVGVLDVESPEQHGRWGENLHGDPEGMVLKLRDRLGIEVMPPAVMGSLFGVWTKVGVLASRDVLALYAAVRLQELSRGDGLEGPSVCEIGGGLGGAAYYAQLLGLKNYTIVDLPLVNALHGYYLVKALPAANVRLHGETESGGGSAPALRIVPTHRVSGVRADVLFNMDSFPEMHADYAVGYLRTARENGAKLFLSINQEARAPQTPKGRLPAQTPVRELVQRAGGYTLVSRHRHWLKAGYVEEVFRAT